MPNLEFSDRKQNDLPEDLAATVYTPLPHDRLNPNTWDILFLDRAIPLDPLAKAYMLKDLQSWTRNYLLIPIKLVANFLLATIMTVKRLLPFQFSAYKFMHRAAAFFLNHFVSPEACYLIVRHICLGSNIVNFLIENGPNPKSVFEKFRVEKKPPKL
ncbi:hypothetical protein V2H45_25195 [Tumidithrix elongata RA019]|uniref:Uncharacterized protein n=1 Tax=Tumidithrix elongata BACA0141 TaxID=2716417 RepID=A0AAW9QA15_9CYAN|nr:hypothetical protein [Tumidithrix elongata RA019]